jgi:flavin-dependent dehydrogenase
MSADFATEVSDATQLGPFRGFAGEVGYFRQSFGPGWTLVGDAGYFKDPITAHGITDALRDAELLAQAVASGRADAFRRYQEERDALSEELFETTDAIASFAWDIDTLKSYHQRLNKTMKVENAALAALGARLPLAA